MFKCQFSVMIWIGSFGAKPHVYNISSNWAKNLFVKYYVCLDEFNLVVSGIRFK